MGGCDAGVLFVHGTASLISPSNLEVCPINGCAADRTECCALLVFLVDKEIRTDNNNRSTGDKLQSNSYMGAAICPITALAQHMEPGRGVFRGALDMCSLTAMTGTLCPWHLIRSCGLRRIGPSGAKGSLHVPMEAGGDT